MKRLRYSTVIVAIIALLTGSILPGLGVNTASAAPGDIVIGGVTPLPTAVFRENDAPVAVAPDFTITGGSQYSDGFIKFTAGTGPSFKSDETLSIETVETEADIKTGEGEVSVHGTTLYLGFGAGTAPKPIGSVNSDLNGEAGKALQIDFSSPLTNGDFSDGLNGWTINKDRVVLGSLASKTQGRDYDSVVASGGGRYTVTGPNDSYTYTTNINYTSNPREGQERPATSFNGNATVEGSARELRLQFNGGVERPNVDGVYGSVFGPEAISSPFTAEQGDRLAFDWRAAGGSDNYEIYGFLYNVDTEEYTELMYGRGGTQPKTVASGVIPEDGTYQFRFVAGSYDETGGFALGASLYVDNVRVLNQYVTDEVVQSVARMVRYELSPFPKTLGSHELRPVTIDVQNSDGDTADALAQVQLGMSDGKPGGVSEGLLSWVAANRSVALDNNGDPESNELKDLNNSAVHWEPESGGGSFNSSGSNFNASIELDGTGFYTAPAVSFYPTPQSPPGREVFAVQQAKPTEAGAFVGFPLEYGGATSVDKYGTVDSGTQIETGFSSDTRRTVSIGNIDLNRFKLMNIWSAPDDWALQLNGQQLRHDNEPGSNTVQVEHTSISEYYVGAGHNSRFKGDFSEVIVYDRKLSEDERRQVSSYLALKYGLTLDNTDYIASDGTTPIWTASKNDGFGHRITGIGRDNESVLHQKQSKSQEEGGAVTLALGNTIAAGNATISAQISRDLTFFTFSDDGGAATFDEDIDWDGRDTFLKRMQRIHKVDRSANWNNVNVTFRIDTEASALKVPYYLVTSKDDTFANPTFRAMTVDEDNNVASITLSTSQLVDGDYFTFAHANKNVLDAQTAQALANYGDPALSTNPNATKYTTASWNAFKNAYAAALTILNNPNATQAQINAALAALRAAEQGLVLRAGGPGDVGNTTLWLRADDGVTLDDGKPTAWADQMGNNAFTGEGPSLGYVQNAINFNPAVTFDGNEHFVGTREIDMGEAYTVTAWTGPATANRGTVLSPTLRASEGNGSSRYFFWSQGSVLYSGLFNQDPSSYITAQPPEDGEYAIWTVAPTTVYLKNGANARTGGSTGAVNVPVNGIPQIGKRNDSDDENLRGQVAEVITLGANATAADRNKVESYLAVKYGLTLPTHYHASNGSRIWDYTSSYRFRVTAIGRDDASGLYQKQSKAQHEGALVTISQGNRIAATNDGNSSLIPNLAFLVVSDNNGSADYTATISGGTDATQPTKNIGENLERMVRTFRVDKSQPWTDGLITLQLDVEPSSPPLQTYLIVNGSGNANFPTATTKFFPLDASGLITLDSAELPDNAVFTFAKVSKTALQAKLAEVNGESLNPVTFTPSSWAAWETALAAANAVLNDPAATQEEIDQALAELEAARLGLTVNIGGPGGVTAGLTSWIDARQSVEEDNAVKDLTQLKDLAANDRTWTRVGSSTSYDADAINFNAALQMNGSYYAAPQSEFNAETEAREVFSVQKASKLSNGNFGGFPWELGGVGTPGGRYGGNNGVSQITTYFGSSLSRNVPLDELDLTLPGLLNISSALNDWTLSVNNQAYHQATVNTPNFISATSASTASKRYYFGAGHMQVMSGAVSEMIVYDRKLSSAERQKVNSYLGLKYGLTLVDDNRTTVDYVASNYDAADGSGTKIWTAASNAGYGNRVTGIGRDDVSALQQLQAKSQESGAIVTVAYGNAIAASNEAHTGLIGNDLSFFTFSDNGAAADYDTEKTSWVAGKSLKLMERNYKVEQTNWFNSEITFEMDAAARTENGTYYLLVSSDGAFDSPFQFAELTDGKATIASAELPSGSYFTFGYLVTDKRALQAKVVEIGNENLNKARYTPSSWEALQTALTAANQVLADPDATPEQVAAALAQLTAARAGLAEQTGGPGGVLGAALWLKADSGARAVDGGLVGWDDQTGTNRFAVSGSPGYVQSGVNFNPAVTFRNTNGVASLPTQRLTGDTSITYADGYAVFRQNGGTIVGSVSPINNYGAAIFGGDPNRLYVGNGTNNTYHHIAFQDSSRYYLAGYDISSTSDPIARLNGSTRAIQGNARFAPFAFVPMIGGSNGGGSTSNWLPYNGDLAELILFPTGTEADRNRVESYLALKYGITLNEGKSDYVASNGTTNMWTAAANAGYGERITGIGRDDNGSLLQKQSKSQESGAVVSIALGQAFQASNAANEEAIANDLSFLTFSDNGGSLDYSAVPLSWHPTQQMKVLNRIFKVDKTNWHDGDVTINLDGAARPGPVTYLAISDDTTFQLAQFEAVDANGNVTLHSSYLTDGVYFTFINGGYSKEELDNRNQEITAENLQPVNYTPGSWQTLQTAQQKASAVIADIHATPAQIEAALAELEAARAGLQPVVLQPLVEGNAIAVSGGTPGATVTLYDNNGQPVATGTLDAGGAYVFPNVPEGTGYTVKQTVNGTEGAPSAAVDVTSGPQPGKPVLTLNGNAQERITAGSAYTDAGVTVTQSAYGGTVTQHVYGLPDASGLQVPGLHTITYAASDNNGSAVPVTRTLIIAPQPLAIVGSSDGERTITVSGGTPGALVKLYDADGNEAARAILDHEGKHTFANVPPGADYTAKQTVNSVESDPSNQANVADRPTLQLLGDAVVTIPANTGYTDAGAKATDPQEGDITSRIQASGFPTDWSQFGTYTITYEVSNSNNEAAVPVTRTLKVVPPAPELKQENGPNLTVSGLPNATVTLYDSNGTQVGQATLDNEGKHTFTGLPIDKYTATQTVAIPDQAPLESFKSGEATISAGTISPETEIDNALRSLGIVYTGNDTWESVTAPVFFIQMAESEARVTWSSSDPNVVNIKGVGPVCPEPNAISCLDGEIHRQTEERSIIVTATATLGGISKERTFLLIVKAAHLTKAVDTDYERQVPIKEGTTVPVIRVNVTDGNTQQLDSKIDKIIVNEHYPTVSDGVAEVALTLDPNDAANEFAIEIDRSAVQGIAQQTGFQTLRVHNDYATLHIDKAVVDQMNANDLDLFFRIVPLQKTAEQVKNSVRLESVVLNGAAGKTVVPLGTPLKIETNYRDFTTTLLIPFAGSNIQLPTGDQQSFLNSLAVFIEHTDGQKVLRKVADNTASIVYSNGTPVGISVVISKFSTFTVLELRTPTSPPVSNGGGVVAPTPDISLTTETKFEVVAGEEAVIGGQASAGATVEIFVNGESVGTVTADGSGNWSYAIDTSKLAPGTHTAYAVATLGNATKQSDTIEIVVRGEGEVLTHYRYINGYEDDTFRPNRSVTRAEIAMMLARLLGKSTAARATSSYDDVAATHWASGAIESMREAGLMLGYGGTNHFAPDQPITRAEIAAVMSRLTDVPQNSELDVPEYADVLEHWARNEIRQLQRIGVISEFEDGNFYPNQHLTRAETVTILNRVFERGPLVSELPPRWSDVPSSYWAYQDVEEASRSHEAVRREDGKEQLVRFLQD